MTREAAAHHPREVPACRPRPRAGAPFPFQLLRALVLKTGGTSSWARLGPESSRFPTCVFFPAPSLARPPSGLLVGRRPAVTVPGVPGWALPRDGPADAVDGAVGLLLLWGQGCSLRGQAVQNPGLVGLPENGVPECSEWGAGHETLDPVLPHSPLGLPRARLRKRFRPCTRPASSPVCRGRCPPGNESENLLSPGAGLRTASQPYEHLSLGRQGLEKRLP